MQWFRQIDKDRSGTLDVHELQQALALGRINFSLKTVQCIIRLYDSDGDGKIGVEVGFWRGLNCDLLLQLLSRGGGLPSINGLSIEEKAPHTLTHEPDPIRPRSTSACTSS